MTSSQDVLATADLLLGLGRLDEAETAYYQALPDPQTAARAQYGLGLIYQHAGDAAHAAEMFESALPDLDGAYRITALMRCGQVLESLGEKPKAAVSYFNAGATLFNQGHFLEAAKAFRLAQTCSSTIADLQQRLIAALEQVQILREAEAKAARADLIKEQVRAALTRRAPPREIATLWQAVPDDQDCADMVLDLWKDIADPLTGGDQDHQYFVDIFETLNGRIPIGRFPFYWEWAAYAVLHTAVPNYARHRELVSTWSSVMDVIHRQNRRPTVASSPPARPLRIGVLDVSGVFSMPQYFKTAFEPALRALQAARVEVFLYLLATTKIEGAAKDLTLSVKALEDSLASADVIAADDLDILLLPTGFLTANPLKILSSRPARRLVMWHHTHTTFGPWLLDAVIADTVIFNDFHRTITFEPAIQLDRHPMLFGPPFQAPTVAPAPRHRTGYITFVVANRPMKVHAGLVQLWARILERVPGSRLMFVGMLYARPRQRQLLDEMIDATGLDRSRLLFAEPQAFRDDHLGLYAHADIALDTFPFNGGMITFESLWQGVPVVSRYDDTPLSRTGLAFLSPIGLGDLVAASDDAYVDIAVALANDGARLDRLRASLREDLTTSSLMNPDGYAEAMIDAFHRVLALPAR